MSDLPRRDIRFLFGTTEDEKLRQHPALVHSLFNHRRLTTPADKSIYTERHTTGQVMIYWQGLCQHHKNRLERLYQRRDIDTKWIRN